MSVHSVIIGSDNGLSPVQHQAIICTNADLLSIGPLWTYASEIQIKIQNFTFMKMLLKMLSGKWRPFYPCGKELSWRRLEGKWQLILTHYGPVMSHDIMDLYHQGVGNGLLLDGTRLLLNACQPVTNYTPRNIFQWKCIKKLNKEMNWKYCLQNDSHFVEASMCWL